VLVSLLVLVTAVAVLAFTRDEGEATPEAAVRSLFQAIEANDAIGALEQLPPGERKDLEDELPQIGTELERLGLLRGFDPRHVGDAQVRFEDVALRTTPLADGMAAVELVGGAVEVQLPAGRAPLTDRAREVLEGHTDVSVGDDATTVRRDFGSDPLRLIAVREGGGWHTSVAYTIADALRLRSGLPLPEIGDGKGPPAIGSNTPEEAVVDLVDAYADGDPQRTITVLSPDDARVLYDYAPVFVPPAREAALLAAEEGTFDVQRNSMTTEVEGTGSTRTVRVTGFDVDIRDELKKIHVTYDGTCLRTDYRVTGDDDPYEKHTSCDGHTPGPDEPVRPRDNPLSSFAVFGGGAELPTFTVVERNGRWFISPVRTLLDSLVRTLRGMEPGDVDALATRLEDSWRGGFGDGISGRRLEPYPHAEAATDPAKAQANAQALVDGCAHLTDGAQLAAANAQEGEDPVAAAQVAAAGVAQRCVDHLVETQRIAGATLQPDGSYVATT